MPPDASLTPHAQDWPPQPLDLVEPGPDVVRVGDDANLAHALRALLERHGLGLASVPPAIPIPGSYWGDDEAGLVGDTLYARPDTPVHSVLHEACHWLCMDGERRKTVHTDAGGTDTEENAVCYLQALLAETLIPHYSRARLLKDMDAWGYHFILGSAAAWFAADSDDAQTFLRAHHLMTDSRLPTFQARA